MTGPDAKPSESAPEPQREDSSGSVGWAIALAVTIVIASSRSQVASPLHFQQSDKLIHYLVFGLLGTLLIRTRAFRGLRSWRLWIAIAAVSLFGLSDEIHQSFTPGRDVEVGDWVVDTLGAITAVCLYVFWGWYRRVLEFPLWHRRRDLALIETKETEKGER